MFSEKENGSKTALIAFAIASVYDPAGMITGGFSGLAIMVKQLTEPLVPGGVPLAVTICV